MLHVTRPDQAGPFVFWGQTLDTAAAASCTSRSAPRDLKSCQPPRPACANPAANRPGPPTKANSSSHDQHQKNCTGSASEKTSATLGMSIASFGQGRRVICEPPRPKESMQAVGGGNLEVPHYPVPLTPQELAR